MMKERDTAAGCTVLLLRKSHGYSCCYVSSGSSRRTEWNLRSSGFTTRNLRKWRNLVEKSSSWRWFLVNLGGNLVQYACEAWLGCGIDSWGSSWRVEFTGRLFSENSNLMLYYYYY